MKSVVAVFALAGLLSLLILPVNASPQTASKSGLSNDPEDPQNLLPAIQERGRQRDSLFPASPLGGLHDSTTQAKDKLYEATGLKLGFAFNHLFQGLSESLPGKDDWGTTSDVDFIGTWELINRGEPTQGQIFFGLEGRWDYGTTGPTDLGPGSLGSLNFTANAFARYQPVFLPVRNLYWQQGSKEAGWIYRAGYITPDQILSTSSHLSPITTFLTIIGTGGFTNALPDSGFGAVAAWFVNDRVKVVGLISDANADRQNWGDIGEGDLYKALEFDVNIAPKVNGHTEITLWHTDGTKDEKAINGMFGPSGWGIYAKYEQELTADGKAIGIVRYGKNFEDSALYDQQFGAHFLYYDPDLITRIQNDVVGVGFNWGKATQPGSRSEYNVELFYRLPIFPLVDMTLSYQSLINLALDPDNDHASAFSLRLRTTF